MKLYKYTALILSGGFLLLGFGGCSKTLLNALWILPQLTQSLTDVQSLLPTSP